LNSMKRLEAVLSAVDEKEARNEEKMGKNEKRDRRKRTSMEDQQFENSEELKVAVSEEFIPLMPNFQNRVNFCLETGEIPLFQTVSKNKNDICFNFSLFLVGKLLL